MSKVLPLKRFNIVDVFIVTGLCIFGVIVLYPFYNAVLMSVVPQHIYLNTPFILFPKAFTLDSYRYVFAWKSIWTGLRVTAFVTVVGTFYNLFLTVFLAYALSKPIPGRKLFTYMIVFTMYFSGGLIPYFLLVKNLGLQNSIFSMILPAGINVMYMFMMRSYFNDMPVELAEAARIDGASELLTFLKIILPLSKPMLATIALFYSVDRWNEWWLGQLFVTKLSKMPLQLFIRNMLAQPDAVSSAIPDSLQVNMFPQGIQMATIVVTMLPIVCVYPLLQKHFAKGIMLGAVKG